MYRKGDDFMVTLYNVKKVSGENEKPKFLVELRGLATDDKPQVLENGDIENGSQFIEINTGDLFLYDIESKTWKEI